MNRTGLILGFILGTILGSQLSNAQYSTDFQTNIISGVTSNWIDNNFQGGYFVGSNTFADVLLIQNGGVLSNKVGYLGYASSSSNNIVVVDGSTWSNGNSLVIGLFGSGNKLTIRHGGNVFSSDGNYKGSYIGHGAGNNNVVVTGNNSLWKSPGQIIVGDTSTNNSLVISNGGQVVDRVGHVGFNGGSNNSVAVTGLGSLWSNSNDLLIGTSGGGNSLTISNFGEVVDSTGRIGVSSGGSNNCVLVAGYGAVWSNSDVLYIGDSGVGNSLTISNGAETISSTAFVGYGSGSSNNSVYIKALGFVVRDTLWRAEMLHVGEFGSSNLVVISGSGSLRVTNLLIGAASTTCDNIVQLNGGSVIVTNATTNAVLEVRNGEFILNGGTLQVDRFVMTNACAQFIRTGGTFIYGTAVLDPNRDDDGDGIPNGWEQSHGRDPLNAADANVDTDGDGQSDLAEFQSGTDPTNSASAFRIVEIAPDGDDIMITWTTVGGKKYAVQFVDGTYTNGFSEFQPIIVAPGVSESTFSVIDLGAATNAASQFYRIRLVP